MFKKIIVILCLLPAGMQHSLNAQTYRPDISVKDYIMQLKFKLASLRNHEERLKNILIPNFKQGVLFGSIGLCKMLCHIAEHNGWIIKSDSQWLTHSYATVIISFYSLIAMLYLFTTADIEVVKEELDALQMHPSNQKS